MNIREKTCCFTGHRDIPRAVYSSLSRELDAVVRALIGKGVRFFGAGGALGSTRWRRRRCCVCGRSILRSG